CLGLKLQTSLCCCIFCNTETGLIFNLSYFRLKIDPVSSSSRLKTAWVDEAGGRASTRQRRSPELNIQCLHGEQQVLWLSGTAIQKVDGRPNGDRSVGAARSLKGRP
ncbi:chaperone protein DnaJ, partial [Striga asiatica]